MKISRNEIVLFCSVVTFVILLIVAAVRGTLFQLQSIFVAVFFAGWVALLVFCIFTLVLPRVRATQKASRKQKNQSRVTAPLPSEESPRRSPRSHLPVRERISAYVEERRREEGIPAPTLLRPTKSQQAAAATEAVASHITPSTPSVSSTEELPGLDENLEFDLGADLGAKSTAPSSGSDELPGFDGDLDLDGMGAEDIVGADDLGLDDSFDADGGSSELDSTGDASDGELPGFDGDLDVGSDSLDDNFDDLGDAGDDFMVTADSSDEMGSLDDSGLDDFADAGDDSFDADGGDDLMTMDDSGLDDFADAGDDSFDADGGDDLMTMDDAGMDDSMLDDSSMESDGGGLPDFDGDLDASMDDGDLMLADDEFGDLEEIGDLEP